MKVVRRQDVQGTNRDVQWGGGNSLRLIVQSDEFGYSVTETYVRPGSSSRIRYDRHQETCFCIEGSGTVQTATETFLIEPGVVYSPGLGERHILASDSGMRLICVFSPALIGDEAHILRGEEYSTY